MAFNKALISICILINFFCFFITCSNDGNSKSKQKSDSIKTQQSLPAKDTFTVKEYNIYRDIINMPMSVSEEQAIKNAANKYGVTILEAKNASKKVQEILFRNNWFGSPDSEIRHASDWGKHD